MLSTKNIHKAYDKVPVLNGVNISIESSEIVSITGASGAGKSTLLHILGTLDKPDQGEVWIHGENVTKLKGNKLSSFRNKNIGFIFQFHHLLPEFTALENASIPAWIAGTPKGKAKQEAERLLERLGLKHRIHHKPSEMSGGEQQRVAIARALINNPKVVLADEPTGNLDSANSVEIFNLIKSLRDEFKQTFVLVTHNEELAQQSDRIIHMIDGLTTD